MFINKSHTSRHGCSKRIKLGCQLLVLKGWQREKSRLLAVPLCTDKQRTLIKRTKQSKYFLSCVTCNALCKWVNSTSYESWFACCTNHSNNSNSKKVSLTDAWRVRTAVFHCFHWFKTFKYIFTLITTSTSDGVILFTSSCTSYVTLSWSTPVHHRVLRTGPTEQCSSTGLICHYEAEFIYLKVTYNNENYIYIKKKKQNSGVHFLSLACLIFVFPSE